jgi:hypothetical protein
MGAASGSVSLDRMMNLDLQETPPIRVIALPPLFTATISAMHRRLVACGLIAPDTMQITASDNKVWLHHVELDEPGKPIPDQIDRWLSLILALPDKHT